ncbi:DUF2938 domain-containing protein [Pseudomarimonas arenosa]|uniref:DUF2938 family protein n=1 Tax=Pseudomarimonas arenosa TaxID=2774145 RepID=A0AAW3ZSC1_9GAMM|nr:DUF2938 domain-containing protein [Pseudomarimonas arenosa]MBD8527949.1 DUF2938 family protein [Pseudomarimonas arenosa]
MTTISHIEQVLMIGIGATAVLDLWLLLLRLLGVPTLSFALIGRWIGHCLHGRFAHRSIVQADPIRGELGLGWLVHYATGISFAALLVGVEGQTWVQHPSVAPALGFGLCTVLAPICVMQPAMGAGFASSRTATPLRNLARSTLNHAVFGAGLYLSALVTAQAFA